MNAEWWTPERRAAAGLRVRAAWTPERRVARSMALTEWWTVPANRVRFCASMRARFRRLHPDRAKVRDHILEEVQQLTCDKCGSSASSLFVTDYPTEAHVWRCRPCASEARRAYRTLSRTPGDAQ